MKNITIIFSLLIFSTFSFAQEDLIVWQEDQPLTWDNYLAPPIEGMPMNAMTSARPMIEMTSLQKGSEVTINYSVKTTFFPGDSWAIEKNSSLAFLLEHEQLHFDIAELFSRKLRKALQEYAYTNNFADEYLMLYNQYLSQRNDYQALFDVKTNHGGDLKEQKKWSKKISKELKQLQDYAKTDFQVTFMADEVAEETE